MTTPRDRGWGWPGAPGTTEEVRYRRLLGFAWVGGVRLLVRKEVIPLFVGFLGELTAGGYRLDVNADDWGWANRDIRGRPGVKSNHAWGLAIDINAIDNPMTTSRVVTDMPPHTSALALRWGLRWGANYTGSRKDAMHFEFMGRPEHVRHYPVGPIFPLPEESPLATVRDHVASLVAPNGGVWHVQADGGIITDRVTLAGAMAPYYGSVPEYNAPIAPPYRVLALVPDRGGYAVAVLHPDRTVSYFNFPAR